MSMPALDPANRDAIRVPAQGEGQTPSPTASPDDPVPKRVFRTDRVLDLLADRRPWKPADIVSHLDLHPADTLAAIRILARSGKISHRLGRGYVLAGVRLQRSTASGAEGPITMRDKVAALLSDGTPRSVGAVAAHFNVRRAYASSVLCAGLDENVFDKAFGLYALSGTVIEKPPPKNPKKPRRVTPAERVRALMSDGKERSTMEILNALGLTRHVITYTLTQEVARGSIERLHFGWYRAAEAKVP